MFPTTVWGYSRQERKGIFPSVTNLRLTSGKIKAMRALFYIKYRYTRDLDKFIQSFIDFENIIYRI